MKNFSKMPFQGTVRGLLACEDSNQSIVSHNIDKVEATYAGFPGDTHSGLTRAACSRFPYLYAEGTEIKNTRQLTVVATEELAEIATALDIEQLQAGWVGANIELEGIPSLTLLPPGSRLVFSSKATLVVDIENRPCVYPAQIIDQHYPGKGRKFVKQAMHLRGITAWVEREGSIACGDCVDAFFPDQPLHPLQSQC